MTLFYNEFLRDGLALIDFMQLKATFSADLLLFSERKRINAARNRPNNACAHHPFLQQLSRARRYQSQGSVH